MASDSVGHRLDQCGAVAPPGLFRSPSGGVEHREQVVPVDLSTLDAVGLRLHGDVLGSRLALPGSRDRPLIVSTEENRGRLIYAREVHPHMKITL